MGPHGEGGQKVAEKHGRAMIWWGMDLEVLRDRLRARGHRVTRQRLLIFQLLR